MPHGQGTWDPQYGTWEPDDDVYVCSRCEATSKNEDFLTEVHNDFYVCPDCLEEYAACTSCGALTYCDDLFEVNGKQYCEDCANEEENSNEI